jgi:hypothetical protein
MWRRGQKEAEAFARRMVDALEANADKPGWEGMDGPEDWQFWQRKLTEEFSELQTEIKGLLRLMDKPWIPDYREVLAYALKRIAEESTDLGNIALMVCSNAEGLPSPKPVRCTAMLRHPNDPDEQCIYDSGHGGYHEFASSEKIAVQRCTMWKGSLETLDKSRCLLEDGHHGQHVFKDDLP